MTLYSIMLIILIEELTLTTIFQVTRNELSRSECLESSVVSLVGRALIDVTSGWVILTCFKCFIVG
jgi:hypothetical protein